MNLSRAKHELEAAGLCQTDRKGRSVVLVFQQKGRELWQKALPLLSSPVKKSHWIDWPRVCYPAIPAGLTALSQRTMIATTGSRPTRCHRKPTSSIWRKAYSTAARNRGKPMSNLRRGATIRF